MPKKSSEKAIEKLIENAASVIRESMDRTDSGLSFEEYEERVLEIANEAVRRVLEEKLQKMADGFPDQLIIDHNNDWHGEREGTAFKYRRHMPGTVNYHSLVGPLRVRRFTYRECCRGGTSYVPLELKAGLMERMTPCLARCVALGTADLPSRRLEKVLLAAGRRPPSRSTIERGAKDLGTYAASSNSQIEPEVRTLEFVPRDARAIVLGLDRTSVPMRPNHEDDGFITNPLRSRRPRPLPESAHGAVQWRMDYVGTFCLVDASGKKLVTRPYRGPSDTTPNVVTDRMMADVRAALTWRPDLRVAVIQDGAPELWSVLESALSTERLVTDWTEILDWYHLDERLAKCAELSADDDRERRRIYRSWKEALLAGQSVSSIVNSLQQRIKQANPGNAELLQTHANYLTRQSHRTDYKTHLNDGLPIGSGVVEGACKSLVQGRAKRSGQRWSQRGLTATLHLRAIDESDRFDRYWAIFAQRYKATSMVPLRA